MFNPDSKRRSSVLRERCKTQQSQVSGTSQTIGKYANWLFQALPITLLFPVTHVDYHSILDLKKINSDADVLCFSMF